MAHEQGLFVQPIVLRTCAAVLIHALPTVAEISPWLIRFWTELMKSASFWHAVLVCPAARASSAACSLPINPPFAVGLSEELLTLVFRFSIVCVTVFTVTVKLHDAELPCASFTV